MKRILLLLLALLLLCGCEKEPAPETTAEPTQAVVEATVEPTGYYDPESSLEQDTSGAVRCYPLNRSDCYGIAAMGEYLVVFSGSEVTTLTKLSGSNLYISAVANLDCAVYPEDPSTQVSEKGITYYDDFRRELVYLDSNLKEVSRVSLPEDTTGQPILSADRKTLYYCTDSALRAIDLDTGLDKLLRDMHFPYQSLDALHCGDTVLKCGVLDEYGNWYNLFISTETGETLYETQKEITLWTAGQNYFALCSDGSYQELLTGTGDQAPAALLCDSYQVTVEPLMDMSGVVTINSDGENCPTILDYFDLSTGKRTASLELPAQNYPWSFKCGADEQCVWFMCYDAQQETDTVCHWDLNMTPTGDETVYLDARRSPENPDLEGLAACAGTAEGLSQKYGVQILIWTDATACQPWDYTLTPEYQVPLIRHSLELLDQALANFPAGFLEEAAEGTDSGVIRICLVRSITGNPDADVLSDAGGLQFWDNNEDAYVALVLDWTLEQNLYHELFHIMENRVMSRCAAYDNWNDLNPEGFEYDYDYITNLWREDYSLLDGDAQAFIDMYSMSFPKEDRARIMEYAMMPGNEYCFASETMQAKLRQLCIGIREAFDLVDFQEALLWEQYLNEPLAP